MPSRAVACLHAVEAALPPLRLGGASGRQLAGNTVPAKNVVHGFVRALDAVPAAILCPKRMIDCPELKPVNVHAATQLPSSSDQNTHDGSRRPGLKFQCLRSTHSRKICMI